MVVERNGITRSQPSTLISTQLVASLSKDGDVQFRAYIKPGYGFDRRRGLWIPEAH